jgi:hypothetical protein
MQMRLAMCAPQNVSGDGATAVRLRRSQSPKVKMSVDGRSHDRRNGGPRRTRQRAAVRCMDGVQM